MNYLKKIGPLLTFLALLAACTEEVDLDDELDSYLNQNYAASLLVLNGEAETFSAYAPSDGTVYQDIKLIGTDGSNSANPNDVYLWEDNLYVICSGQNSVEKYDGSTMDYEGRIYLNPDETGFWPMIISPVGSDSMIGVSGYTDDEIVLVDLEAMDDPESSDFISSFEELDIDYNGNPETTTTPTTTNALGDNKKRGTTGLASYGSYLYAGNVRYDSSIYLTDLNGDIIEYDGGKVQASGYFREGTLSIFEMDSAYETATLVSEINLQEEYEALGGDAYFPGDGLNPQSLFVLGDKLHIICTGRNGGDTLYYTGSMYIPTLEEMGVEYEEGDEIPGTNADDGVILIMDLSDPSSPSGEKVLEVGGSPVGFRYSMDESNEIMYLTGVGYLLSYSYSAGSEEVLRGSDDPIVEADDTTSDYYPHVLYAENYLYLSDYSNDELDILSVSGSGSSSSYELEDELTIGDGPGASVYLSY
ncbi:MAG: hypothetical protein PQJ59_05590 [Spirochaetales bacterium]|nr:hypothetical protein [Spirochaetales bacterium]